MLWGPCASTCLALGFACASGCAHCGLRQNKEVKPLNFLGPRRKGHHQADVGLVAFYYPSRETASRRFNGNALF